MVDTFLVNGSDPFREGENSFHVSRAAAIQAYAKLEQALCGLFAFVLGVDAPTAGIVFFKIVNSKSRLDIIEKLKKRKLGAAHNLYFNSLLTGMKKLDGRKFFNVHHFYPFREFAVTRIYGATLHSYALIAIGIIGVLALPSIKDAFNLGAAPRQDKIPFPCRTTVVYVAQRPVE